MSAHGFRSVFMVASVAGAALGCYLVSLNVASERAKLESVEERIVLTQRDIRLLQTEIGTRGRLAQLERWNAKVIRLSAPSADQFVEGGFQLAAMVRPLPKPPIGAPMVLASARTDQGVTRPMATSDGASAPAPGAAKAANPAELMHNANFTKPEPAPGAKPLQIAGPDPKKPAAPKAVKSASADPLAPLPTAKAGTAKTIPMAAKDTGAAQ